MGEALATRATDAVGAVARLAGEITIIDGRPLATLGGCAAGCGVDPRGQGAALLASMKVQAWREPVAIERDLDEAGWRAFVAEAAGRAGLDVASPFPFRLEGDLLAVVMHVNCGPSDAGAAGAGGGQGGGRAKQDTTQEGRLPRLVVGIHAGQGRDGLISHFGDPYHCH